MNDLPTIVTPSHGGDLPRFRRLADSITRWADPAMPHMVVVPGRDMPLFRPLAGPRTTLLADEDLLPTRFHRLPRWLNPLPSRRDLFVTPGIWIPVRGWVIQQLVKFAAALAAPSEEVVFIDSDVILIRPLTADRLRGRDGRTRLFQERRVCGDLPVHGQWYRGIGKLLDLPVDPFWGDNYVADLVTWRKEYARGALERIERIGGSPWWRILARQRTLSEYMIYGVYVDQVVGAEAKMAPTAEKIYLTSWDHDLSTERGREAFVAGLRPEHVAATIQSQDPLALDIRDTLLDRVAARAGNLF